MEATKVFTQAYLIELIQNATRSDHAATCPEGCNIEQFYNAARTVAQQTNSPILYGYKQDINKIKIL